jgi:Holliday junction resolvase
MMTPEKKVKNEVVKVLKSFGVYYFYPSTGGYGSSGVPDIVGCYRGKFFAIECKAKSGTTTALQDRELAKIHLAGGRPLVINEANVEGLETLLRSKQ